MRKALLLIIFLVATNIIASAQSTGFTYQGQLQNSSQAASGSFDFEFALFDSPAGGSPLGSTQTRNGVSVTGGIFSVELDFGNFFPGAARYLEIRVRQAGGGALTTLSPRQAISSSPYSVKSLNAENATNANTAATAGTLTGNLAGDVTGTQAGTTVARLRGQVVAAIVPTTGQVLKFNGGQWEPGTDNTGAGGGGTITGVTAGTGLTGGGTTGGVTVGIANSGITTTQLADGSVTDAKIVSVSGAKVTGAVTNSNQLGGVAANQYVQTNDFRLADSRSPTAGSPNYIQNSAVSQGAANFSFSGNGTVAGTLSGTTVNAVTQFNLDGGRILGVGGNPANLYAGFGSGMASTSGSGNAFFGTDTGKVNTAGFNNSFFGNGAGRQNTANGNNSYFGSGAGANATGPANSFFGATAGISTTGSGNSFFGVLTGGDNTSGSGNSFFGINAGFLNTTGENNVFIGARSGRANLIGNNNTFVGENSGLNSTGINNVAVGKGAGTANLTGSNNTQIGYNAEVASGALTFATAIGADSVVSNNNSIVLGRTADTVRVPGIVSVTGGLDAELGTGGYIIAGLLTGPNLVIDNNEIIARDNGGTNTLFLNADGGNVGIGTNVAADTLDVNGDIRVGTSGTNGCIRNNNAGTIIGTCSSDERFKRDITPFPSVLNSFTKLRPVHYFFRASEFPNKHFGPDQTYGLIAQDVEKVLPELVSLDANGFRQIDYAKLPMLTIQAVKELNAKNENQQRQIELQNKTISRQRSELDALRAFVCSKRRSTGFCKSTQ